MNVVPFMEIETLGGKQVSLGLTVATESRVCFGHVKFRKPI